MAIVANTNSLISAAELERIAQITIADTDYKTTLINIASDFIERYCDRKFIKTTYTKEIYNGNGCVDLYLNNYPIVIGTVTVEAWDVYNDIVSYEFTEHEDYLVYLEEGRIYKYTTWVKGHQNYRITYDAGYLITTVPYDLKLACAKSAAFLYSFTNKDGVASEKMGQYSITYDKAPAVNGIPLSAEVINLLGLYRDRKPYEF